MAANIALIGAGHLGGALIKGLVHSGYPPSHITVSNRNPNKSIRLVETLDVSKADSNKQAAEAAEIILLGVKPQYMQTVCEDIASVLTSKTLIISLAGATDIERIQQWLGLDGIAIIRAMANTPMEFREGVCALFANDHTSLPQKNISEALFNAVGTSFWVDRESLLDPLTAAIGSAPAYVLLFLEALKEAAISQSIPAELAEKIAFEVTAGTITLAKNSRHPLAQLRQGVMTPHGVTEYSLKELSISAFFKSFKTIYTAATRRIKEIKQENL